MALRGVKLRLLLATTTWWLCCSVVVSSYVSASSLPAPTACKKLLIESEFSAASAQECISVMKLSMGTNRPTTWQEHNDIAFALYITSQESEALQQVHAALKMNPDSLASLKLLMWLQHVTNAPPREIVDTLEAISRVSGKIQSDNEYVKSIFGNVNDNDLEPKRAELSLGGALTFEDLPGVREQCNYKGFSFNSPTAVGGEGLNLSVEDMYIDLLMRQLTHKSVQKSTFDEVVVSQMRQCNDREVDKHMEDDPSMFEMPWDLPFSVLWYDRGEYKDLSEEQQQCTFSHNGTITDNCPSTPMSAGQMLMTSILARRQLDNDIGGDFLEAGVYRGGMTVLLRGVLASRNDKSRVVYAADSYSGIPEFMELDTDTNLFSEHGEDVKVVWPNRFEAGEKELKKNLRRVGLYDSSTRIVKGYFNETFAAGGELDRMAAKDEDGRPLQLSLVRLDSDAYDSIMDSLTLLWERISVGGVIIVDDFHIPAVRRAVLEFRLSVGSEAAGPVMPISNDRITVCNMSANLPRVNDITWCRPDRVASLISSVQVYPTSGFFYKMNG